MAALAVRLAVGAVALLAGACATSAQSRPSFSVSALETLPELTTVARAAGRDGGSSVRVGDRVLWLFGDTFVGDERLLTATAAWSRTEAPFTLEEEVDGDGAPLPLFRYTSEEREFNRRHERPPECCRVSCAPGGPACGCQDGEDCTTRIALWPGDAVPGDAVPGDAVPGDAVPGGDGRVGVLYEVVVAGVGPYDLERVATGLAELEPGSTVARRLLDDDGKAATLFGEDEPNFLTALSVGGPDEGFVYLYAVTNRQGCAVDVEVARVGVASMADRAAYRFWTGRGWSDDIDSSAPILGGIAGGLGSVVWVDELEAYVSGFIDVCTAPKFVLRTANSPEGPWSEGLAVDLGKVGASADSYAGRLHSALSEDRRLVASFYDPEVRDGRAVGRVHLFAFELRRRSPIEAWIQSIFSDGTE